MHLRPAEDRVQITAVDVEHFVELGEGGIDVRGVEAGAHGRAGSDVVSALHRGCVRVGATGHIVEDQCADEEQQ